MGFDLKLWFCFVFSVFFCFFFASSTRNEEMAIIVFVKLGDWQCEVIVWVYSCYNLVPIVFIWLCSSSFSFRYELSVRFGEICEFFLC